MEAGTNGDKFTDDDILFQTTQLIALTTNRGFGEDACRLLEAGGGQETLDVYKRQSKRLPVVMSKCSLMRKV